MQCGSCGAGIAADAQFCAVCGARALRGSPPGTNRRSPFTTPHPRSLAGSPGPVAGSRGARPGGGGTTVGGPRPVRLRSPSSPRVAARDVFTLVGLAVCVLGVLLPWASVPAYRVSPFNENGRFQFGDWLGVDLADGVVAAGVCLGALVSMGVAVLAGAAGRDLRRVGRALIPAVLVIVVLEARFVLASAEGSIDTGLWLMGAGAVLAASAQFLKLTGLAGAGLGARRRRAGEQP